MGSNRSAGADSDSSIAALEKRIAALQKKLADLHGSPEKVDKEAKMILQEIQVLQARIAQLQAEQQKKAQQADANPRSDAGAKGINQVKTKGSARKMLGALVDEFS